MDLWRPPNGPGGPGSGPPVFRVSCPAPVRLVASSYPSRPLNCSLLFIVVNMLLAQPDLQTDPMIYGLYDLLPVVVLVNMLPAASVPAGFYTWTF